MIYSKKLILLITASALMASLSSCVSSEKTLPPKPVEIAWGRAGEEPESVWQSYDWVIASKEYAMEKFLGK